MKTLKLNRIENKLLATKQMNLIKGGGESWVCTCSCLYADNGGSSTEDNGHANGELGPGGRSNGGDNAFE